MTTQQAIQLHNDEIKALVCELVIEAIASRKTFNNSISELRERAFSMREDDIAYHNMCITTCRADYNAYLKAAKLAASRLLKIELL